MRKIRIVLVNGKTRARTVFDFRVAPETITYRTPEYNFTQRLPYGGFFDNDRGEGIELVSFDGTFGLKERQFNGRSRTGPEIHEELMSFFEAYRNLRKSRDVRERASYLEFHDYERRKHYLASLKDAQDPQGKMNKIHYRYEFELNLLKRLQRKFTLRKPSRSSVLTSTQNALAKFSSDVQTNLNRIDTLRQDASDYINTFVLQPIDTLSRAISSALETGRNIINFPLSTFNRIAGNISVAIEKLGNDVLGVYADLAQNLRNAQRIAYRLQTYPEVFQEGLLEATEDLARQFIDADGGDFERTSFYEASAQDYIQRAATGAREYKTKTGETLQDVAFKQLGDVKRWREIALLNGALRSPYITRDGCKRNHQVRRPHSLAR